MSIITIPGPISGKGYRIQIAGDTPTMDEQLQIDQFISQSEQQLRSNYESKYGPVDYEDGYALTEGAGELFKGAVRGGIGMFEAGALGLGSLLPEKYEAPVRELVRSGAYALSPQADIGREGSVAGTFGEALGSFAALGAVNLLNPVAARGLAAASGAGEASERARREDATQGERNLATFLGAGVGLSEMIPINFISRLPEGVKATIAQRIGRALAAGGVEGAQEAAAQIAQNLIEQGVYNPEQTALEGAAEGAAYGAGVGGLVQGLIDVFVRKRGPGGTAATPPAAQPPAAAPVPPTAPAAPTAAAAPTAGAQQEFDDAMLIPPPGIELRGPVLPGTPEFNALPTVRQGQEQAYAKAMEFGAVQQIMKDAAAGKSAEETAKALGRTINALTPGKMSPPDRAGARNAFVEQVRARIGIPADPSSVEFAKWLEGYKKWAGPQRKKAPERDPLPGATTAAPAAAAQAASTAVANATSPEVDSLASKVAAAVKTPEVGTAPTDPDVQEVTPAEPLFTKDFVVNTLGFSKVSSIAKAAEGNPQLAGKPLSDPAVQARLRSLAANSFVKGTDKAAKLEAALAAVSTPAAEATVAPPTPDPLAQVEASAEVEAPVEVEPALQDDPTPLPKVAAVPPQSGAAPVAPPATPVPSAEYAPATGAAPGATLPGPGQAVPAPPRVIQNRAAALEAEGAQLPRVRAPAEAPAAPVTVEPRIAAPQTEAQIQQAQQDLRAGAVAPAFVERSKAENVALAGELITARKAPAEWDALMADAAPVADVTTGSDKQAIIALFKRGGAKGAEAEAARDFFRRFQNPTMALEEIASRSVLDSGDPTSGVTDPKIVSFYKGLGRKRAIAAAKWAYDNLGASAQGVIQTTRRQHRAWEREQLRARIGRVDPVVTSQKARDELAKELDKDADDMLGTQKGRDVLTTMARTRQALTEAEVREAARQAAAARATDVPAALQTAPEKARDVTKVRGKTKFDVWLDENYSKAEQDALADGELRDLYDGLLFSQAEGYAMRADAATALDRPLAPSIKRMLSGGRLKDALSAAAANAATGGVARIANALGKHIGATKVELVSGLTTNDGAPAAGFFDPKTNTIYLDVVDGMNYHTLLHEATHAVVSDALSKPGHPLTKQLQTLLAAVRGSVSPVYGTSNLQEFAAELMSNPEFQAQLAQLKVRGQKISAFDRAVHAVRNFVRRLAGLDSVPMETALTRGDQIITALMAPAPAYRDANALYSAQTQGRLGTVLQNVMNNAPLATPARLQKLEQVLLDPTKDAAYGTSSLTREVLLRLTPLHYLVQVAKKTFPNAPKLNELVNAMSGEMSRVRDMSRALNDAVGRWASKNQASLDRFNSLVNYSTLYQVDPEITTEQAMKKYGSDTERVAQWRAVKADWEAVGASGQAEYRRMRNVFRTLRKDLEGALDARLDASIPDAQVRARVKTDLYSQLTKAGTLEPYFPIGRKGDYWLSYNALDPRSGRLEFFVEAFESRSERDRARAELQSDPSTQAANFRDLPRKDAVDFTQAPAMSFMANMISKLQANNVDSSVVKLISNLYLDTVPETSFLQAYRKRKGTLGFNKDAIGTSSERAASLAHNIAQLKYGAKFAALKADFARQAGDMANRGTYTPEVQQMHKQLDAFADFASSPSSSWIARLATNVAFNMTLGFNISTAMLNLAQVGMVVFPTLGGRYGYAASTKAIGAATRLIAGAGTTREIDTYNPDGIGTVRERVSAAPSLENYDFNDPSLPQDVRALQYLVEVGRANGQFNRSIAYDILEMDTRLPSTSKSKVVLDKMQAASGWMLHHSERLNRETTLAAAYNLELGRLRDAGVSITPDVMRDAAKQAIYVTEMTNGGTAAAANPRIAHGDLGRVVFMYKRYGVSMYSMLFDTARRALRNADPEDRRVAMKQITGIAGMTALMSGVAGMPLFGTLAMLYDTLLQDDDEPKFAELVREFAGDGMYRGALNATLGVNVASRISLSDLLFRESMIEKEQPMLWTAAEQLGGPAVGTYLNMERGVSLMLEGDMQRGIEAAMPAAVRYLLRSLRYYQDGGVALTRGGDAIVEDIHAGHLLGQALGFAPAHLSAQQEINAARKRFERSVIEQRSKLLDQFAAARREGDREALQDVVARIGEYNKRHSYYPITRDSVERSLSSRAKTDERTFNGVSFNPRLLDAAREFASDYGA
jgi:hypothetical protein